MKAPKVKVEFKKGEQTHTWAPKIKRRKLHDIITSPLLAGHTCSPLLPKCLWIHCSIHEGQSLENTVKPIPPQVCGDGSLSNSLRCNEKTSVDSTGRKEEGQVSL